MGFSILFGGLSYEHEISIVSAITLKQRLGNKIANYIFVDSNHDFYLIDAACMTSKFFSDGSYKQAPRLELGLSGFFTRGLLGKKPLDVGVVINLIHGADGEDGMLAGLLDFFGVRFIGPRLEGSVLSYNKRLTKLYARDRGVKTLPFSLHRLGAPMPSLDSFPVIVKPLRLGSSLGVSVVKAASELEYALEVAYEFDSEVLIEPFMPGIKEYNLAGAKVGEEFIFSIVEEPAKKELLGFEEKYLDFSRSGQVSQANLSDGIRSKLQKAFMDLYDGVFEGALIRCDFFVMDDEVFLNEINPVPGSLANYLFDDLFVVLDRLASSLPSRKNIRVGYQYIHKIQQAKGK